MRIGVGVIGGGAWGTALAQVAAAGGEEVLLWAREPEVVESVNAARTKPLFLPGVPLSRAIRATANWRSSPAIATRCWSSRRPSICARCSPRCRRDGRWSCAPRAWRKRPPS
jgi:hypothetical protein